MSVRTASEQDGPCVGNWAIWP